MSTGIRRGLLSERELAALEVAILERRRADPGVKCHNTGWHSERYLLAWPEVSVLVSWLRLFGELVVGWANVNEPGDFNRSHVHQGPWTTSGVLFVAGHNGDLVLETDPELRVTPRPGTVVLFPALTPHRVEPCTERRISVGFNLR